MYCMQHMDECSKRHISYDYFWITTKNNSKIEKLATCIFEFLISMVILHFMFILNGGQNTKQKSNGRKAAIHTALLDKTIKMV